MRASNYPMIGTSDVASNLDWLFWSRIPRPGRQTIGRSAPSLSISVQGHNRQSSLCSTAPNISPIDCWSLDI